MTRAPAKPVQMAVLTIGYHRILLPADKAMKVAEAMQHAMPVDVDWKDRIEVYQVKEEPLSVAFTLVRTSQIQMPHGDPAPMRPARPRLLK
ncbi:MAG: hypothetical protein PHU77_00645 [Simplicispira sp.]|nr:hypothetical protein [Simplicispira sp.]